MTEAGNVGATSVRRAPRWMVGVLTASLALNLVVIGLVAGAIWRPKEPPPTAGVVIPNLLGYASMLPSDRRKVMWEQTAEERRHLRPFRRAVRAARDETTKVLATEPFDRERYQAAQARQAEAENNARAAVQDLFVKIADNLTPEERLAFPRWREHRRPPGTNLLDEPDHQAGETPTPR
jgi:uncharacterized membrane protein